MLALLSHPLKVHDAVKNLDVSKVKELLATSDPGFERPDGDGNTALHLAVVIADDGARGLAGVDQRLVRVWATPASAARSSTKRSAKTGRSSPMHLACEKANASIVKALVDAGEMVGVGHATLNRRTVKVVGLTMARGARRTKTASSPVSTPKTRHHLRHIECLRRATDDENADASNGGRQEEIDACHSILKLLIESGAEIDAIDGDGATALHHAARG